jgi:hypothetical protein
MSSSPVRSNAIKAALIAVDPSAKTLTNTATVFAFQYNPEQLTRSLSYFNADGTPMPEAKTPPTQGSPVELFNLTLELDAADQLEHPQQNPSVAQNGLNPALATLQSMMTSSAESTAKVVLFWWGPNRLLPTRLVSLKICEQAFDLGLNPLRASIGICLRVLGLGELKSGSVGYAVCRNQLYLDTKLAYLYKDALSATVLGHVTSQIAATNQAASTPSSSAPSSSSSAAGIGVSSSVISSVASVSKISAAKKSATTKTVKTVKTKPKK